MKTIKKNRYTRRDTLKMGAVGAAALAAAPLMSRKARAQAANNKLLFVVAAGGGASILDSFLPVLSSEGNGGNTWADAQIEQPNGSNLKCPIVLDNSIEGQVALGNNYAQSTFLSKHAADTVVMTQECTSVNHLVAAERAMTGNSINKGQTLGEAAALAYGQDMILPNVNMGGAGYFTNGRDVIPDWARAEPVGDARLFPFALHGYKGVQGAPSDADMARARGIRNELEANSGFHGTFKNADLVQRYLSRREGVNGNMEADNLITKLMMFQSGQGMNLSEYDLETSPLAQTLINKFPTMLTDPFEAQGALGFLLARYGVSASVTLSTSASPVFESAERIISAPIGFDWSHNDHRGGQNSMWSRILKTVDGLIELLKEEDYLGDASLGKMWDRSVIFIATEFGRSRVSSGGSGHHLNNGNVLISPRFNGNRVYGGVDPNTCLTYGFNPTTGDPAPGTLMREEHVYSAVCHGMGIDFDTRIDMPCMVRDA